jgi:hypothetical protein
MPLSTVSRRAPLRRYRPAHLRPTSAPSVFVGLWPTTVSVNGRYLRDQNGDPYMIHGDTAWELSTNVSLADAKFYLDDRAAKGVNAIIMEAPIKDPVNSTGADFYGNVPFTGTAFQSPLTENYWQNVDAVLQYAGSLGITVFFWMAYLGFNHGTEGWWTEIAAASNAQVQAYGATLGARYKNYPNIVWVVAGDYIPTATEIDRYDHIMQGIQSAGDTHLATAHLQRRHDGAESFGTFSWFTLNSTYSVDPNFIADTVTAYSRTTIRPTFLVEGRYENFNPPGPTLAQLRREQWQQILAGGIGGHFYGNENVWSFNTDNPAATDDTDWKSYLGDPGIDHSQLIQNLMDSHLGGLWQEIAPDLTDTFLTSGESSGATQAAASFSTHVGLVYIATTGSITVDLTEISGGSDALCRWYDPTDGGMFFDGVFSTGAPHTFAHPGTNTAGDNDWVLVIKIVEGVASPPLRRRFASSVPIAGRRRRG